MKNDDIKIDKTIMRLLWVVLLGYQLGVQSFSTTTNHHGTLHPRSITSCQPAGVVGLWFHNHHRNHHKDDDNHSRRLGTGRISWLRVDDTANDSLLQWPTISHWKGRKWYGTQQFAAVLDNDENNEEGSFVRDNHNDDDDDNNNNNNVLVLQEEEEDRETC
jgi:hypothetical protein